METETIAARNVVELLMQEEFGASICNTKSEPSPDPDNKNEKGKKEKTKDEPDKKFIYGWDC